MQRGLDYYPKQPDAGYVKVNSEQTFLLKQYKDFDSLFLTLRVDLYAKTNISSRVVWLYYLEHTTQDKTNTAEPPAHSDL